MPNIRFRSRHLHATFYHHLQSELGLLGWVNTPPTPSNFGADPLSFMDFQPDERAVQIKHNTVAVTLGDYDSDDDEELGATGGGLRSASYDVFIDVYMEEQSLAMALCDDIRDIYTDLSLALVNQITQTEVPDTRIEISEIVGPVRPSTGVEQFKKYWRSMHLVAVLYFQS